MRSGFSLDEKPTGKAKILQEKLLQAEGNWWTRGGKEKVAVQFSWPNAAGEKETLLFPEEIILPGPGLLTYAGPLTGAREVHFSGLVLNTVSWSCIYTELRPKAMTAPS